MEKARGIKQMGQGLVLAAALCAGHGGVAWALQPGDPISLLAGPGRIESLETNQQQRILVVRLVDGRLYRVEEVLAKDGQTVLEQKQCPLDRAAP